MPAELSDLIGIGLISMGGAGLIMNIWEGYQTFTDMVTFHIDSDRHKMLQESFCQESYKNRIYSAITRPARELVYMLHDRE